MKKLSSRLSIIAIAVALGAVSAPAFAQDKIKYDDEIVVVPYGVQTYTEGRTSSGARIDVRSLQRVVTTEGLNLRYDGDIAVMQQRIEATARASCDELGQTANVELTTDRECVRDAVRSAQGQLEAAVSYARG